MRWLLVMLVVVMGPGCLVAEFTTTPPPEDECAIDRTTPKRPEECWEDGALCPAQDEEPWATCSTRYVCNVGGEAVCVRAINCGCLEDVNECAPTLAVELPQLCKAAQ